LIGPPPAEKKTEKIAAPPLPNKDGRQRSTLNLGEIGKVAKTSEEKPTLQERIPDRPIDEDVLKKAWDEFIQLRKAITPDLSMMTRPFTRKGNIITMSLAGNIENILFEQMRSSLITFLRDRTGNSSLLIQTEIVEQPVGERKLHTTKEKFDHLAEKNPVLKELKERFGLDPDLA